MLHKIIKPLIVLTTLGITFLIGNKIYQYYTFMQKPVITVVGLEQDGYYRGMAQASIDADTGYKIGTIKALLDDKPFAGIPEKIGKRSFSQPFTIDTTKLEDGQHSLKLHVIDASKNQNNDDFQITFYVDNKELSAALVDNNLKVFQGKTAHIKVQANKQLKQVTVNTLNQKFQCTPESANSSLYECFIPIDCEEKATEFPITVEVVDNVGASAKLAGSLEVRPFDFPKQRGFTVSKQKIDDERELSMSDNILKEAIGKWMEQSPTTKMWNGPFDIPMQAVRIPTPFGEVRTTPERGRYLHKGLDLANMPKSVVWAAQNGKVIIKDRYLMSGNTVVVDHGLGVTTLYAHLDSFADIEVGDTVRKGNPLGKVGMTGYANGYHLHWELRIHNVPVDPTEWTTKVY